jgi:hypothetical protein
MEMSGEHLHQLLYLKEISLVPTEQEAKWTPRLLNLNILLQSCVT